MPLSPRRALAARQEPPAADLRGDLTPEQFARQLGVDLSLSHDMATAVALSLQSQLAQMARESIRPAEV